MKKLMPLLILVFLSSSAFGKGLNHIETQQKECFAFEGKHLNLKVYKKDNYQIKYHVDDEEWITVDVNWKNALKYSMKYLMKNVQLF